jgi:6-pyruvoyltetrahydropterin/6-carboxytetrahydropterin synthase
MNDQLTIELTSEITLRAIHRLSSPTLSEAENSSLYGKCYRMHGHDYRVAITIRSGLDEKTGLIFNRDRLNEILHRALIVPFDGSDLNKHFTHTSGEALAEMFFERLKPEFPAGVLRRVCVRETPKNSFTTSAP